LNLSVNQLAEHTTLFLNDALELSENRYVFTGRKLNF
jgi:hypothetical protein